MKITHVLNNFLPNQTAGTEIYVWSITKVLQKHNIEVEVVIPNHHKKNAEHYFYDDIKVIKYAEPSVVDKDLIMGRGIPDGLENFIDYLKESKPTIVHFHEISGSNGITLHHLIAVKKMGIKVIITFHLASNTCKTGTLMYLNKEFCDGRIDIEKCSKCYLTMKGIHGFTNILLKSSYLFKKLQINTVLWNNKFGTALGTHQLISDFDKNFKKIVSNCDKVIALTDWYKDVLIKNGVNENKIEIIKQGLVHKSSPKIDINNEDKKLRLIFLGRISQFKGLHLLIDVFKNINEQLVSLHIYGQSIEIDYENKLKKETSSFSNIHWMGKLNPENVIHTLKKFDVLCLCSTFSEMSPLVIQEAFAAGIPVIASNVYGNAEQIINGVNGLLFDFNNRASLKHEIEKLINDRSLIQKMKSNIHTPKSFEEVGIEHINLYKKI